jgi:hypothetical protein
VARVFPHLVLAPSYRLLLDRLLTEVRTTAEASRLATQWIVTPASTLAAELRVMLARQSEAGIIAGVRITPVLPFLARLSQIDDLPLGPRWNPVFDVLLYRLLQQEHSRELAGLREIRGGQTLLRPVFLDLAEAGFGLAQEEILQEVADSGETDSVSRGVLRLYLDWLHLLDHAQLTWMPLQYQELGEKIIHAPERELSAVLGESDRGPARIHVYGFYDFTDVVEQVLTAIARRADTTFYLPSYQRNGKVHHAFEFVAPVLASLRFRLGNLLLRTTTIDPGEAEPVQFFLNTFPEGSVPAQPGFLTYQRAGGLRAEVISAAVQVRRWIDDPALGLEAREIHVLAPQAEMYADLVTEVFEAFAIPLRVAEARDELAPGARALRAVVRIWQEQAPTETLLSLFRDFPDMACLDGIELDQFETRLRQAGFDGRNWPGVLKHAELIGLTAAEQGLVEEILDLWIRRSAERPAEFAFDEILARLKQISGRWLPDPAPLAELIRTLELLPGDLRLPLQMLLDLIESQAGQGTIDDPPEKSGVLFAPLMRARGLAPRAVVLLGLASGRLPYPVQEDPLLGDPLRLKLGRALRGLGHRLSPKTALVEEMALLFVLVNGSSEYVHWVIPETDENGRGLATTPWVQRYLQHWERNGAGPPSFYPKLARGPAEQARLLLLLDPERGSFLPPVWSPPHLLGDSALGLGSPDCGYILRAIEEKDSEVRWNGVVPDARLTSDSSPTIVRVTELEKLSRCPFHCYSRLIGGWEALTPLDFSQDLRSTEWGSLLHGLFDTIVSSYRQAGVSLRGMAEDLLQNEGQPLLQQIDELSAETSLQLELLPSLFRKAAKSKLLQVARDYWEAVRSGAIPDGTNASTESRRSAEFPGLPGVRLSGQIDRMDDRGNHLMIIDYKSGREPENLCHEMRIGFRLQPLLYPWLQQASAHRTGPAIRFSYVFFGKSPLQEKTVPDEEMGPADDWLQLFASILSRGVFIPCSNEALELLGIERAEPCQFCEYASLCRRFERRAPVRMAQFLHQLLPERLAKFEAKEC